MKRFALLILFFCGVFWNSETSAQLVISSALTPAQMVQNVLLGGGVTISNITFTGGPNSRGTFSNGAMTNLGLDDGIVLCTGNVSLIDNPASYFMSTNLGLAGDGQLNSINNGCLTYDACILEFDFVPLADTVKFRYVFGSEEYPNYVCSQYQDIFAFFLNGPNPSGGNYNNYNIALIPGTNLPVSVNSINNGTAGGSFSSSGCISLSYSNLFVDNANIGGTSIAFGGFTDPLTATCVVTPCQTYHMKIAVADGYNGLWDSGVFLEANSFSSTTYTVSDSYSNPALGNQAVEGCSDGIFTFTLPSAATSPVTISYTVTGSATSGTDYTAVANSVTIPTGQTSGTVTINTINDGTSEGTETVIFNYMNCCNPESDTIYIVDNSPVSLNMGATVTTCPGGSATLSAAASGGTTPYTYVWSNSAGTSSSVSVSPASTTIYTVTATDFCGTTVTGTQTVTINVLTTEAGNPQTICSEFGATLTATNGGNYAWSSGGSSASVTVFPTTTTMYYVTVTSGVCVATDSVQVNVIQSPTANAGTDNALCSLTTQLQATPSVGTGTWTYTGPGTISFGNAGSATTTVTASANGSYIFTWTEDNGNSCTSSDNVSVSFNAQPVANAGNDNSMCSLNYVMTAVPSVGAGTWTYTGPGTVTFANPNNANTSLSVNASGSYTFVWTENNGGGCISSDTVIVDFFQPVANAGTDIAICQLNTSLNAIPSVGTGTWTQVSGPGTVTFSNAGNANTPVSASVQGAYVLQWTEVNGGSCSSSDNVTVVFTDMPVANAGTDASLCLLSYQLQATPSAGIGTWTVIGPGNASFANVHGASSQVNVSTTGNYSFIWTENNGNGCVDADTVQIQLTQTPTSSFTASSIHCFGDMSTIIYTGTGNAQSNFVWDFSSGIVNPGVGAGPHTVTWGTSGSYLVSLQVELNGCQSAVTTTQLAVPSELVASIAGVDLSCYGSESGEVSLTVSGGNPFPTGDSFHYLWNNGSMSQNLTEVPQGYYSVTITDASGCSVIRNTTINQPPQLALTTTNSHSICPGESATLTAYPAGGTYPYYYFWNGAQSGATITVTPSQNTTYSVYVTDANGCLSQNAITTISIYPPLHISATVNIDSVCPGEQVIIAYVVSDGSGAPYTVTDANGNILPSPYMYYPEYGSSFVLNATDGCNQMAETELPLYLYPAPPNAFLADTVEGCQPLTVNFNEINEDQGQTYVWDFGDSTNLSLAKNPVHTYTSSGTFDVTLIVTSTDRCRTVNVVEDFITVYPKPVSMFTHDPLVVSVIKPIVTFTNMSQFSYANFWSFGTGDSSSAISPTYTFPGAGTYTVTLVTESEFGCLDTAIVSIPVADELTVYAPTAFSPDNDGTNDNFFVSGYGINPNAFYVAVYDRWGQIIWETKVWNEAVSHSAEWDGRNKSGKTVKNDTYAWLCIFTSNSGKVIEKAGTVTVIR